MIFTAHLQYNYSTPEYKTSHASMNLSIYFYIYLCTVNDVRFGTKQAEKLKSCEMKEGWWMMMNDDEGWWRMNGEWWRVKD